MTLSAKEQANKLWEIHQFYWGKDSELESKQRITMQIQSFIRLFSMTEKEKKYWNEVKKYIYEI